MAASNFNALPRAGGILDQPAYEMQGLIMVQTVRAEKQQMEMDRKKK